MRKSLTMLTMVAAAALAAAPGARAGETVKVDVPFAFVAADHQLPAGEYQFVRSENPRVVQVFSEGRRHVATLVTMIQTDAGGDVGATFLRLGDEYFLKAINGTDLAYSVPPCHAERLAQARRPAGTPVALAGR